MTAQIQAEALLLAINLKDPRIIFTLAERRIVAAELSRLLDRIAELEAQVRPARAPLEPMHPPGLTSANAILPFNHGWRACQQAYGIKATP